MQFPSLSSPKSPKLSKEEARYLVLCAMHDQTEGLSTAILLSERRGWHYIQNEVETAKNNVQTIIKKKKALLAQLEKSLAEEEAGVKGHDFKSVHKGNHLADTALTPSSTKAHVTKLRLDLLRAEAALKIRGGEHPFVCITCGELIPKKRLDANPLAVRCIDCAELVERS